MNKKYTHSLLVFIKRKYAYSVREEQLQILADGLKGKFIGGGTDLSTRERDQQFYFKSVGDAKTFLEYPTVREAIKNNYELVELENV